MSKKAYVRQYQPVDPGPLFAQASDPTDFMDAQVYAHDHIEKITADLLTGGAGAQVTGFARTLTSGLSFTIATGHVVDAAGKSYEVYPAGTTAIMLGTAHATLPRIDRVVAVIESDADANIEFRPFQRIRTSSELAGGVPVFPPENFNIATEKWNKATVIVKTGTPAGSPVAPTLASNEVPLFQISVTANLTTLTTGNFTDQRDLMVSLRGMVTRMVAVEVNSLLTSGLQEPDVVRRTGYEIVGSFRFQGLAAAAAPTVVPQGTAGSTSRYYWIVARDRRNARALPSAVGQTTTGNAILSGVNFDRITWAAVTYATDYDVLTNTTNSLVGSVKLGTTVGLTMDNTGQATSAYTQPVRNETKDITVDGYVTAAALTIAGDIQAATISGAVLTTQLDSRYVNVTGDVINGQLHVWRGTSGVADAGAATFSRNAASSGLPIGVTGEVEISILSGAGFGVLGRALSNHNSLVGCGVRGEATMLGGPTADSMFGVYGLANAINASNHFLYGVYGTTSGSGGTNTHYAGYFVGNTHITGALTKGSGTFFIDSPVDPFNKSIYHGFVESNEYLLIYRVKRTLKANESVSVSMDHHIKCDEGTFAALTQDVDIIPLSSGIEVTPIIGDRFDVKNLEDHDRTVFVLVMACRADNEIKHNGNTDTTGRLIVQHLKKELDAETINAMLSDQVQIIQAEEPAPDVVTFETVPALIGTKGYPLHANAHGVEMPKRKLIRRTVAPVIWN